MATPTTIYITPKQRKALFARARQRNTTFSDELRSAVDLYLELPADFDEASFGAFIQEAKASMHRSIAKLDESIGRLKQTVQKLDELDGRLNGLDKRHLRSF
jgi:hypothetical protein